MLVTPKSTTVPLIEEKRKITKAACQANNLLQTKIIRKKKIKNCLLTKKYIRKESAKENYRRRNRPANCIRRTFQKQKFTWSLS
jgi:hypothetical protein